MRPGGAILAALAAALAGVPAHAALLARAGPAPGALTVLNTGDRPEQVGSAVAAEGRAADGSWKPVRTEMNAVATCDREGIVRPLPALVTVAAHAELHILRWLGNRCRGQCNLHCRMDFPWGPGPFRFRLTDGAGRPFYSQAFRMPARGPGPPL